MSSTYRFLIIDTYYPQFLSSLYSQFPALARKNYRDQLDFITDQCFGTADFYSKNLKKLGCEAVEVIPNNEILQRQWALEQGLKLDNASFKNIIGSIPGIKRFLPELSNSLKLLEKQIIRIKPDVLYMQDLSFCPPAFLSRIKKHIKILVGQIACPLPPLDYLKPYDLILTSFPHYVGRFRDMGIKSEYLKIAFEPAVLEKVAVQERKLACTFVGGISSAHKKGTELLERLAREIDIDFFGYGSETLERESPIIPKHRGEVWGHDMYKALLSSKITINRHIDVAENNANNMRLYEATGCGALLITDYKDNLKELFNVGQEVIAYRNEAELIELIHHYSANGKELQDVAKAGQKRTLTEHTYYNRMIDLVGFIKKYI